jgi:hypothetical protein
VELPGKVEVERADGCVGFDMAGLEGAKVFLGNGPMISENAGQPPVSTWSDATSRGDLSMGQLYVPEKVVCAAILHISVVCYL